MSILLKHTLLRHHLVIPGLLGVALLGFLLAIQGCVPFVQNIEESSQKDSNPTGTKEDELTSTPEDEPAPEVGQLAPSFTLVDLEGNSVSLSDFQGKTIFVNFWTTWCPPCRIEMPDIEALYQEYKNNNIVVIGINILEPEDTVRQFVEQGNYNWIFVLDSSGRVTENYEVALIPTSFFIDREGIIRGVTIGTMTKLNMEDKLAEAIR